LTKRDLREFVADGESLPSRSQLETLRRTDAFGDHAGAGLL
jgi:hypothetical protein